MHSAALQPGARVTHHGVFMGQNISWTTEVVAVTAEDDYVTVMMPRRYPDPRKPGAQYSTTWFDTWRFVDGKADEHWDPATITAK